MISLRLGFALTILAACAGNVQSAPLNAPQAEIVGHLAAAFATHDPARVTYAYRAMGDSGLPAAEIVESMINAMGYELLENGEIDAAIRVFDMNAETFPLSANTWDSLAEAAMTKGDHETAIRYYRVSVSLKLDTKSKSAVQKVSYANGNKS